MNKYPLQGSKKLDFYLFCEVVELMKNKAHLTTGTLWVPPHIYIYIYIWGEGLDKIRELEARINTRGSE